MDTAVTVLSQYISEHKDASEFARFDILMDGTHKRGYRGIRQGTCFAHNFYNTLSKLKVTQLTDAVLMTAAEVWYLRAEAALRGWTNELVMY